MTGGTELDVARLMDLKGNQWYSYDMTGWTVLDVVTIDGLTKVTSDTVMITGYLCESINRDDI